MNKNLLIILCRNPQLGKVKTRLAATVGDDRALAIYLRLLARTREIVHEIKVDKVVYYSDHIDTEDNWDNNIYHKRLQFGDHLGGKMFNAFTEGFQKNYESICIIGTDCWDLNATHIEDAFRYLQKNDAVVGPAEDGGYYLLGVNALYAEIFMDKSWGTNQVLRQTIETLGQLDLHFKLLPVLRDVDEEKDLPKELQKVTALK